MYKKAICVKVDDDAWEDAKKKGKNVSAICNRALRREMGNNVWRQARIMGRLTVIEEARAHQQEMLEELRNPSPTTIQQKLLRGDVELAAKYMVENEIYPSTEAQWFNNALDWGVNPIELEAAVRRLRA
jgi:hypothetical protein